MEKENLRPEPFGFEPPAGREKPLLEHVRELRKRLLVCVGWVVGLAFLFLAAFGDELMQLVTAPVNAIGIQFVYVGLAEALTSQLKVALIASLILSAPVILWEIWKFVQPGLFPQEQKNVLLFGGISLLLFTIGVVFGYGVVFLAAITFFVSVGQNFATPMLSIDAYVNFLLGFVVPFGIAFQLPVALYFLARAGIVNSTMLKSGRRYAILIIAIVSAILTPPDVLSQLLMGAPLCVLYEVGVRVVAWTEKKRISQWEPAPHPGLENKQTFQ